MKSVALAALFAAGALVAGTLASVGSAQTTEATTETVETTVLETTTVEQTTTAPATTVVTTAGTPTTTPTTTSPASESSGTPAWVWVLVALLGASAIGLLIALLMRRGGAIPDTERRLRLQGAVESWTTQGWALVSQTADTAVLQRGREQMTVSVDPAGQISTRPLNTQPPA